MLTKIRLPKLFIIQICLHSMPVKKLMQFFVGLDWSANNDLIVSASLDGSLKVWNTVTGTCMRTIPDANHSELLCCLFQPVNNNLLIVSFVKRVLEIRLKTFIFKLHCNFFIFLNLVQTGNTKGEVRIANISTGLFMKNSCRVGGNVLSLASDTHGQCLWAGNDKVSVKKYVLPAKKLNTPSIFKILKIV